VVRVDSMARIDLLRGRGTAAVARLRAVIEAEEAAVAPVIVQQILQGARSEAAFRKLAAHFMVLPMLGTAEPLRLAHAAARLYARARWRGITPRSPHDCLIAAIAVAERVPPLRDDADFARLAHIASRLRLLG
jgi:predicted nucleic acid-binding protein